MIPSLFGLEGPMRGQTITVRNLEDRALPALIWCLCVFTVLLLAVDYCPPKKESDLNLLRSGAQLPIQRRAQMSADMIVGHCLLYDRLLWC